MALLRGKNSKIDAKIITKHSGSMVSSTEEMAINEIKLPKYRRTRPSRFWMLSPEDSMVRIKRL
jgi:hypothetical protein